MGQVLNLRTVLPYENVDTIKQMLPSSGKEWNLNCYPKLRSRCYTIVCSSTQGQKTAAHKVSRKYCAFYKMFKNILPTNYKKTVP